MVSELGLTDLIFENDGDGDQSVGPKRGFLKAGIRWKRTVPQSRCGLESFSIPLSGRSGTSCYAPGMQIVLARNALFALFISGIPALMPVIGLKVLHLKACPSCP